jgi:hypothetical protein
MSIHINASNRRDFLKEAAIDCVLPIDRLKR